MASILAQTDLHAPSSGAIALLREQLIRRGIPAPDLHETDLTRVSLDANARPRVDDREVEAVGLVTPEDEAGWCTSYAAHYLACESMVLDLPHNCPLALDVRSWAAFLGTEEAVFGTYSEKTQAWQWTRYWWGQLDTFRHSVGQPAPGHTLQQVFVAMGRQFHGQHLDRVLRHTLSIEILGALAGHTLLWTARGQRRRSMNG